MQTKLNPITVVFALAIVFFAVFIIYSRQIKPEPYRRPITADQARGGLPAPDHDDTLGIMYSSSGRGRITIMGFLPPPTPPPLMVIGCRPRDELIGINDEPFEGKTLKAAIEALEENGTPFTLRVRRRDKEIEIEVTEWPEPMPMSEEQRAAMARRRGRMR
jgi:hypothetical protein